jgi:hypothetical protein
MPGKAAKVKRFIKRVCHKKEQFDCYKSAAIRNAYLYFNNGWMHDIYECRHCAKYHLTKRHKISSEELDGINVLTQELRFTRCDRPATTATGV